MSTPLPVLRRLWAHDKTLESLKVAVAFSGVLLFCFGYDHDELLIELVLGVIAAALAETPDRPAGRAKALIVMLLCFALAAFSVRILFAYPWLFVCGLALSTFGFVMLGAFGERYATIATASVILAIYTMLSVSQHPDSPANDWGTPLVLLGGALWYGLISLLESWAFPNRPLRQAVAQVFTSLAAYLRLKSNLLKPIRKHDVSSMRLSLAAQNGRVVGAMNRARQSLLLWDKVTHKKGPARELLQAYFLAQEVHERASSAHHPYESLSEAFSRSDVLFRCAHLMKVQAHACARLGDAILRHRVFEYGTEGAQALSELGHALAYVQAAAQQNKASLEALADLGRNITTIELRLAKANRLADTELAADASLSDSEPKTLREMWRSLLAEFRPSSRRFRHGLRLAAALSAGYALIKLADLPQGYWVMLTTIFVCQPNFSSTWLRLGERVSGTILGLVAATVFISSFPHPLAQLALLVVSGVAFFVFRAVRYGLATACITVLVMICFNQFGSTYALIWPRLLDTLLGSALAVAAVGLILPEWHGRRVHHAMAQALISTRAYLQEILAQYRTGPRDDLAYRVARRDAHMADAALSSTLASMLTEPARYSLPPDEAYRFLHISHSLLGYVSALGAHRELNPAALAIPQIQALEICVVQQLDEVAKAISAKRPIASKNAAAIGEASLFGEQTPETAQRLMRQLQQIEALMPELRALTRAFSQLRAE